MKSVFRRCGCRKPDGKTYGALPDRATPAQKERACPKMLADPKHGRWSFRVSGGFDPVTKRRRQYNGGTFDTRNEAQKARNALVAKLDQGNVPSVSKETVAEFLPRWLERRSKFGTKKGGPLRSSTIENYDRYIHQDIIPSRLGSLKVRDVKQEHVQAFIEDLTDAGRGPTTVRRVVAVLQGAFGYAVRERVLGTNPARDLELPPVYKKEFQPWEPEQVGHFLDVAAEHRLGALFELDMFTGLRRGEIIGLRWEHVDLARRELVVRNNLTRSGDGDTKTQAGRRRVALDDRAVGALVAWQIKQEEERNAGSPAYDASGYVFTMEDGRPLKPQYVTRLFDRLRREAGLPKMTFHGQRHQSASLMLSAGADITVVSKLLGHSDTAVTSDLYTHLLNSKAHQVVADAAALVPRRRAASDIANATAEVLDEHAAPGSATPPTRL